jgi:hypothetical protein
MVETGVRGETESKGKVRILLFIVIIVKLVLLLGQIMLIAAHANKL